MISRSFCGPLVARPIYLRLKCLFVRAGRRASFRLSGTDAVDCGVGHRPPSRRLAGAWRVDRAARREVVRRSGEGRLAVRGGLGAGDAGSLGGAEVGAEDELEEAGVPGGREALQSQ